MKKKGEEIDFITGLRECLWQANSTKQLKLSKQ